MSEHRGVWIWAEQRGGKLAPVVYELLAGGRALADQAGGPLTAVLAGEGVEGLAGELIAFGADRAIVVDDPALKDFRDEAYTHVLAELVNKYQPNVLLLGATTSGRSLAPRVATRLKVGLTSDCTALELGSDGVLKQIRPTYGGSILATVVSLKRTQMATVRPKAFGKALRQEGRAGEVVKESLNLAGVAIRTKVTDFVQEITETVKLEDADIIVSGGRGLGGSETFGILRDLAKVLGAAVGASRAAVDSGWIPYSHQVGQTGKTVSPKIYIACGISGAIQHLAGMQSSEIIVAINKNPDAPIFQIATYGIVGDLKQVVPALTEEFKRAL